MGTETGTTLETCHVEVLTAAKGKWCLALSSGAEIAGAGAAYQRQALLSPHNMYLLVLSEQGLVRA
ncbi:hypothetical protein C1I97_21805 [Streptomyces sp. NTH33]|uniref:hypothetical protein n=1 Tax=Streptomyces sp. NTH33 TaxID=1735453 RepID=UPI000DA731C6|nr:hypothetical protein [Streptomyces sp. NTH33]PZH02136.1 hypothetical protein C1I97_21805 [Streptomyces sp. NTH33]